MRRRPDPELIVLACQGSTDAVEVLFDRYWSHAWKAATRSPRIAASRTTQRRRQCRAPSGRSTASTKRVLVVLTDGESQPPNDDLSRAFDTRLRVETIFVHLWNAAERIYEAGVAEGGYRPEAGSAATIARAASLVGGRLVDEGDVEALAAAVRAAVGEGPTVQQTQDARRFALMPWAAVAVVVPLGFLLVRRNARLPRPLRPWVSPRLRRAREPAARHPALSRR